MTKNIWNRGETFSRASFPGLVISSCIRPWLCDTWGLTDSCGAGCVGWLDPWVPLRHPWSCDRQEWEMGFPELRELWSHGGHRKQRGRWGEQSYHSWNCIMDLQVVSLWWDLCHPVECCSFQTLRSGEAIESKNNSFQFLLEKSYSELAEASGSTHWNEESQKEGSLVYIACLVYLFLPPKGLSQRSNS